MNDEIVLVVTVGLSVVFLALIILAFIIFLFSKIFTSSKKTKAISKDSAYAEASILEIEDEEMDVHGDRSSNASDEELVAVLTAAVMASMGNTVKCNIRVTSYRRIKQTSPIWNVASRKDQIASML